MKFRRVTASKYIGTDGYTLRRGREGRFSIYKDSVLTKWGTNFQTVRSAEIFLDQHDYIHASTDSLPINELDIQFIEEMYGDDVIKESPKGDLYDEYSVTDKYSIAADKIKNIGSNGFHFVISLFKDGNLFKQFDNADDVFVVLDRIAGDTVFASVTYRGTNLRYILARKDNGYKDTRNKRRTPREIANNLVRVKSSNVWAYGVEIKDNDAKVGDVYVQFKGKNGGPDGGLYRYYDVPLNLWRKFISAPSKGHFVHKYLRNNFLYSKLTGDKRGKLKNAVNH